MKDYRRKSLNSHHHASLSFFCVLTLCVCPFKKKFCVEFFSNNTNSKYNDQGKCYDFHHCREKTSQSLEKKVTQKKKCLIKKWREISEEEGSVACFFDYIVLELEYRALELSLRSMTPRERGNIRSTIAAVR